MKLKDFLKEYIVTNVEIYRYNNCLDAEVIYYSHTFDELANYKGFLESGDSVIELYGDREIAAFDTDQIEGDQYLKLVINGKR